MQASRLLFTLLTCTAHAGAALAQTAVPNSWELSGEFNTVTNATNAPGAVGQVWTYVQQSIPSPTAAANLLLPIPWTITGPLTGWAGSNGGGVYQNTAKSVFSYGPAKVPIRGVVLFPGWGCERVALRFNPPTAGTYRVSGQFWGSAFQTGSLASTGFIRKVGGGLPGTVFTGVIATTGSMQRSFTSKTVGLQAGDKLDFEVGCGPSNVFSDGLFTGVHAVVERTGNYCPAAGQCPPPD